MTTARIVEQALDYLSNTPELFSLVNKTQKIAGFRIRGIHPIALVLGNRDITVFVRPGAWQANPALHILSQRVYQPEKSRNSNLASCAPELNKGHAAVCLKLADLTALQTLCRMYAEGTM